MNTEKITFTVLRIAMSFIFLWAFIDKVFGLGFATTPDKAWINGGSPTYGFLTFGTKGPFAALFHSLAGLPAVDWVFMIGLLLIGLSLLLNRFINWGSLGGCIMLLLMYIAAFPSENNPLIDEHIIYALVLALIAFHYNRTRLSQRF
jgi:thiosulfate dehydrogenase (quinone) large subunit